MITLTRLLTRPIPKVYQTAHAQTFKLEDRPFVPFTLEYPTRVDAISFVPPRRLELPFSYLLHASWFTVP